MFEWDTSNESKLLAHGVTPAEAEETFEDERPLSRDAYYKDGERRDAFVAATLTGRILTVVYTQRGSAIRVITAYRTRGRLRREYLEGR